MKIFGIFGDPIVHSLSPAMQNAGFKAIGLDAYYFPFRVTKERLSDAINGADAMGYGGLNLTIPLKEKALEIVETDELSKAIGAVNTISFGKGVMGHNTDGLGAKMALEKSGVKIKGSKILLIGAGGAARAIAYTLSKGGSQVLIANRNVQRAKELAAVTDSQAFGLADLEMLVPQADVIINATAVGMNPRDKRLFDGNLLHKGQVVFDIVYNRETELLKDAIKSGAVAIDGVMMLVYQGAKALEIWTGNDAPVDVMEKAVRDGLQSRKNLSEEQ
jgi:shikimate dehydrogenase